MYIFCLCTLQQLNLRITQEKVECRSVIIYAPCYDSNIFSSWMFSLFPRTKQTEEAESTTSTCPASCSTWTMVHIIPVTECFLFLTLFYTTTPPHGEILHCVWPRQTLLWTQQEKGTRSASPITRSIQTATQKASSAPWFRNELENIFNWAKSDWWTLLQLSWWMGTIASGSSPNGPYSRERSCFSTTGIL